MERVESKMSTSSDTPIEHGGVVIPRPFKLRIEAEAAAGKKAKTFLNAEHNGFINYGLHTMTQVRFSQPILIHIFVMLKIKLMCGCLCALISFINFVFEILLLP
jgi:hypothetical protein